MKTESITITKSVSKDFKLSKNYNSVGGSVGFSMSVTVSDVTQADIDKVTKKLDDTVNNKIAADFERELKEADKTLE